MRQLIASTVAVLLMLSPFACLLCVGLMFLTLPGRAPAEWLAITTATDLPADGEPRLIVVRLPQYDAWTRLPDRVVELAYVRRSPADDAITALVARHQLQVRVDFDAAAQCYRSQCWIVRFDLAGRVIEEGIVRASMYENLRPLSVRVEGNQVLIRPAEL